MAQWSAAAEEQRKNEKIAALLTERLDLFKLFRKNGWQVNVVKPVRFDGAFTFDTLPDNTPLRDVHFRVKMQGGASALVRSLGQLLRLAKGLN